MSNEAKFPEAKASGSSKTVTVACKLPHGLRMQLYTMVPFTEPVIGGGTRESKRAEPVGDVVVLKGNRAPFGVVPEHQIIGGFGLTPGVDREFFENWLKQYADHPAVKGGLVFAADGQHAAMDKAKERGHLKSGLEPLVMPKNEKDKTAIDSRVKAISKSHLVGAGATADAVEAVA